MLLEGVRVAGASFPSTVRRHASLQVGGWEAYLGWERGILAETYDNNAGIIHTYRYRKLMTD